jgi:hypothetical protein
VADTYSDTYSDVYGGGGGSGGLPVPTFPPTPPPLPPVRIDALNLGNLSPQQPIEWRLLDINTLNFNAVGAFTIQLPATARNWQLITFDSSGEFVPVVLYVDWHGIFQVPLIAEQWEHDLSVDTQSRTGLVTETITLSGADLLALLANRVCYPHGTSTWSGQATAPRTITGPAETVIKTLVSENTVTAADAARKIPNFAVATDQGRGGTITYTITPPVPSTGTATTTTANLGASLMDMIRTVAAQTSIGVKISLSGGQFVFDCYVPRNLANQAVFAYSLGNLRGDTLADATPTADVALLQSGAATGAFVEHDSSFPASTDPWRRAESYSDQTATTTAADLTTAYTDVLTQGGSAHQLSAIAVDGPMLRFGADAPPIQGYELGDTVTVALNDGLSYTDIVSAVQLTADATGGSYLGSYSPNFRAGGAPSGPYTEVVIPTIGLPFNAATDPTAVTRLATEVRKLQKQIQKLRKAGQ